MGYQYYNMMYFYSCYDKTHKKKIELNIICFKCGNPGHITKKCNVKFVQCSIPNCDSITHNSKAHKAMEFIGITDNSDKARDNTDIATPIAPILQEKTNEEIEAEV